MPHMARRLLVLLPVALRANHQSSSGVQSSSVVKPPSAACSNYLYDPILPSCLEGNSTCAASLRAGLPFRGILGYGAIGSASPSYFALGAPSCPDYPTTHGDNACVSAPFSELSIRNNCGLWVYPGCKRGSMDGYEDAACEMRSGSLIALRSDDIPALDGVWVVGNQETYGGPMNAFWVFRAEGQPHGFSENDDRLVYPGSIECLLYTVPPPGQTCCFSGYSYDLGCPARLLPFGLGAGLGGLGLFLLILCSRRLLERRSVRPEAVLRAACALGFLGSLGCLVGTIIVISSAPSAVNVGLAVTLTVLSLVAPVTLRCGLPA